MRKRGSKAERDAKAKTDFVKLADDLAKQAGKSMTAVIRVGAHLISVPIGVLTGRDPSIKVSGPRLTRPQKRAAARAAKAAARAARKNNR